MLQQKQHRVRNSRFWWGLGKVGNSPVRYSRLARSMLTLRIRADGRRYRGRRRTDTRRRLSCYWRQARSMLTPRIRTDGRHYHGRQRTDTRRWSSRLSLHQQIGLHQRLSLYQQIGLQRPRGDEESRGNGTKYDGLWCNFTAFWRDSVISGHLPGGYCSSGLAGAARRIFLISASSAGG